MKNPTLTARANLATQVLQNMNDGKTVVEACQLVGMPRSTFYNFMKNNPEAVAEMQAMIEVNNRALLGMIETSKAQITHKLIEIALADDTKPKDRLAIMTKLIEWEEKLMPAAEPVRVSNHDAAKFLDRTKAGASEIEWLSQGQFWTEVVRIHRK